MSFLLISILLSVFLTVVLNLVLRALLGGGRRRRSNRSGGIGMFGPIVFGHRTWTHGLDPHAEREPAKPRANARPPRDVIEGEVIRDPRRIRRR